MSCVKKIFVHQSSMYDCGAASLGMIIRYYNGNVPLNKLKKMLHVSSNGTTAFNIVKVASKLGFNAKGYKVSNSKFLKINTPFIAHVTIDHVYNHFVVIDKVTDNHIVVADPMTGIKKMTLKEFEKIFNNIVITFIPITKIPCYKEQTFFNFIFEKLFSAKWILVLITIISLTYLPLLYLVYLQGISSVLIIMIIVFFLIREYILNILIMKLIIRLKKDLLSKHASDIIKLPVSCYQNYTVGELLAKYIDINKLTVFLKDSFLIVINILELLLLLVLLVLINKSLFMITVIASFIFYALFLLTSLKLRKRFEEVRLNQARNLECYSDIVYGYETIKNLHIENTMTCKFNDSFTKLVSSEIKMFKLFNLISTSSNFILTFIQYLVLGLSLLTNSINTIYIVYIISQVFDILKNSTDYLSDYHENKVIYDRLLVNDENITYGNNHLSNYDIKCVNLSFSYDEYNYVLNGINLEIKMNEKIAVRGSSSSGKSTLVKLLARYYETSNQIFIGNIEIGDYQETNEILYISEHDYLFNGSILSNLTLDDSFDSNKIDAVKKLCLINHDINKEIVEDGFNLSSGEKEKIILARSLLKPSKILILDEVFNKFDINTERIILKNILNYCINKTLIVITHKIDNIDLFDRVIELNNGVISNDIRKCNT